MMLETILLIAASTAVLVALRPTRAYRVLDAAPDVYEPGAPRPPLAPVTPPGPSGTPTDDMDPGDGESALRRLYALRDRGEALPVIAAILNAEGHRTVDGAEFTPIHVWQVLRRRRRYAARREEAAR